LRSAPEFDRLSLGLNFMSLISLMGLMMSKKYAVYFGDNGWTSSSQPPWDSRPITEKAGGAVGISANENRHGNTTGCPGRRIALRDCG
jgi:hypothetical protein